LPLHVLLSILTHDLFSCDFPNGELAFHSCKTSSILPLGHSLYTITTSPHFLLESLHGSQPLKDEMQNFLSSSIQRKTGKCPLGGTDKNVWKSISKLPSVI
jgi:hypothetical protein